MSGAGNSTIFNQITEIAELRRAELAGRLLDAEGLAAFHARTIELKTAALRGALAELMTLGLTQADVLRFLSESDSNVRHFAGEIEEARESYTNDDVEIDDYPLVSASETGVWVSAWVYVYTPEAEQDDPSGDAIDKARDRDEESRA